MEAWKVRKLKMQPARKVFWSILLASMSACGGGGNPPSGDGEEEPDADAADYGPEPQFAVVSRAFPP